MTKLRDEQQQIDNDEISLKELIQKIQEWIAYLKTQWKLIIGIAALGGIIGFVYASFQKPTYLATTTFVLEEDKGHYIDSCFLGRAISNAAEIFSECLDKGIEIPFFVISSPTKMNNYDSICDRRFKLYREDIVTLLKSKFLYFPLSENGRIPKEKYFETAESCFNLSDELILNQNKFIETLK